MVTFRNNNNGRSNNFRRGDRNFKNNGDRSKFSSTFTNNDNFQRKAPGRNNHLTFFWRRRLKIAPVGGFSGEMIFFFSLVSSIVTAIFGMYLRF